MLAADTQVTEITIQDILQQDLPHIQEDLEALDLQVVRAVEQLTLTQAVLVEVYQDKVFQEEIHRDLHRTDVVVEEVQVVLVVLEEEIQQVQAAQV